MSGRLITFEGTDGSGKSTQFDLLCARLEQEGLPFRAQRFPRYDNPSSVLLRMYLEGKFGGAPADVDAYTAAVFFSADRAAAFLDGLFDFYHSGGLLLCDRYTPSNAIHQGGKLYGDAARDFLTWLFDFEYERLRLPRPSLTLFLDMPEKAAVRLLKERARAAGSQPDIHEIDLPYLRRCREMAEALAASENWVRISCADKCGEPRPPGEIAEDIYAAVSRFI